MRYHFHIFHAVNVYDDDDGQDFARADDAIARAAVIAHELAAAGSLDGFSLRVVDQMGNEVARLPIELERPLPSSDGQASLMLCASVLHLLVEEGVAPVEKVMDTVNGIRRLAREMAAANGLTLAAAAAESKSAAYRIEEIADGLAGRASGTGGAKSQHS
jgi:hypothetical protein